MYLQFELTESPFAMKQYLRHTPPEKRIMMIELQILEAHDEMLLAETMPKFSNEFEDQALVSTKKKTIITAKVVKIHPEGIKPRECMGE
jgi:hypothetical protein